MIEPIHRYFEVPLSEWIKAIPNELEYDAVGLWQIIPVFKEDFGLVGDALENATTEAILGLFEHGAKPVVADKNDEGKWILVCDYQGSDREVARQIAHDWIGRRESPNPGDIWFAKPA